MASWRKLFRTALACEGGLPFDKAFPPGELTRRLRELRPMLRQGATTKLVWDRLSVCFRLETLTMKRSCAARVCKLREVHRLPREIVRFPV